MRALFGAPVREVGDCSGDCSGRALGTIWEERGRFRRLIRALFQALFWQALVAFGDNAASFVDSVAALSQGAFAVPNHEAIDHRSGASPGATTKQSRC